MEGDRFIKCFPPVVRHTYRVSRQAAVALAVLAVGVGGTVGAIIGMRVRYAAPGSVGADPAFKERVLFLTVLGAWVLLLAVAFLFVQFG